MRIFVWRPSEKRFFRRPLCYCCCCGLGSMGTVRTALASAFSHGIADGWLPVRAGKGAACGVGCGYLYRGRLKRVFSDGLW
ncbi:hypothetical protein [Neisseria animaloris]|uniref:hypothetical protein n=1 Tax=Neisseria animaloris TaxID=326522 RepID=UPI00131B370B|nr:hypothetical protein [Neisseria animaloris]